MIRLENSAHFYPLEEVYCRYLILYGGAGSGKSVYVAQRILLRILQERAHRILVCRKVANTLKQSVFQLFVSLIAENNLGKWFRINKSDKTIHCLISNSTIVCVGLDDPEKLKSIADITSIWVEEGTELTQLDFDQLDLRLRGETEYYKQIIITFNPTDERHWLKKRFFDTSSDNTHIHHSTFQHNAFLDAEYKQVLLSQAQYNANYYQIYALGEWGKTTVKSPFMYNFDITKHTVKDLVPMPNTSYRLSFDFNVNPFVCLIMQISQDNKKVYFLQELILNNGDVPTMCARIKQILTPFELSRCYVTGDAMQRKKEITQRDNLNAWIMIQRELGISDSRMQVPRSNPLIANSQKLCNLILHNHPCVLFDSKMATTINDMMFVECNPDGNKISILKDRSNEDRRADALDAVRYAFNTWFSDYMIKYK